MQQLEYKFPLDKALWMADGETGAMQVVMPVAVRVETNTLVLKEKEKPIEDQRIGPIVVYRVKMRVKDRVKREGREGTVLSDKKEVEVWVPERNLYGTHEEALGRILPLDKR